LGTSQAQLRIVDIDQQPSRLVGRCDLEGQVSDITVDYKGFVYVAVVSEEDGKARLMILEPGATDCYCTNCTLFIPSSLTPSTLYTFETTLFIGGDGEEPLQVWDTESAQNPKLKTSLSAAALDGLTSVSAFEVHGDHLTMAGRRANGDAFIQRVLLEEVHTGEITETQLFGLSSPAQSMVITQEGMLYALLGDSSGDGVTLAQLDLDGNPPDVVEFELGDLSPTLEDPRTLLLWDNLLLISESTYGAVALDISDPDNLVEAGAGLMPGGPTGLAVLNSTLYVTSEEELLNSVEVTCGN
jgi:hypothetical protein